MAEEGVESFKDMNIMSDPIVEVGVIVSIKEQPLAFKISSSSVYTPTTLMTMSSLFISNRLS